MRLAKFKKKVVLALCSAMLCSGSGLYNLPVCAEESDVVLEETVEGNEVEDVQETETEADTDLDIEAEPNVDADSITDNADDIINEEQEEGLEEDVVAEEDELIDEQGLYGIFAEKNNIPGTAGLLWLWTNEFFTDNSVKNIKEAYCYVDYVGHKNAVYAQYEYNSKGQLVKCTSSVNDGKWGYKKEYEYYDNGDLKKISNYTDEFSGTFELQNIERFEYEYDSAGKCIKERYYYKDDDPNSTLAGKEYLWSTSTYEYDSKGNRIKEFDDYYDETKIYEYDSDGNCIKLSRKNNKGYIYRVDEYNSKGYKTRETHYDSVGNVTIDSIRTYEYEYDSDGDLVKIIQKETCDNTTFTQIFTYDYYPKGSYPKFEKTKCATMYRLYNPNSGEHFYTSNVSEKDYLDSIGWNYEGIAWNAPVSSDKPVYRLYNPNAGDHHYTTNAAEKDHLVSVGWNYEGIGWYSSGEDAQPLYRLYNPNATGAGSHHYTTSAGERDHLKSIGWNDEGIAWYGVK